MSTQRHALARLLAASTFEVIPMKSALEQAESLPGGATVSVTASPAKELEDTIDLAEKLQEMGFAVVPHLAARMIRDADHLSSLLSRMADCRMHAAFVVGGDAPNPGDYGDAPGLLATMASMDHGIENIGIAGYPEGHPLIDDDTLMAALIAKAPHADYISTQMCFDVPAITTWVRQVRGAGVELPIRIGIPGVADPMRLAAISARIGVGASIRYIIKNRSFLWKLLRPGPYKPTRLVAGIARSMAEEDLGITGFHIFTFNQVERTVDWWGDQLRRAGG